MDYATLHLAVEAGVGYLTLASSERFNTLHRGCIPEIRQGLAALEADPAVVCIVISGGEGESFAVGANIAEMKDFAPADAFAFSELGQGLFAQMEEAEKPIIGALNGIVMGGGCDLALACDLRIASDRLRIAHPGAKLGIITGFGGTQKLPRLVGRATALEIFMTSEVFDGEAALAMGLIDRLVPHADFWPTVQALARRMASFDPAALAYAKKLINVAEDVDPRSGMTMELGAFSTLFASADLPRRAAAFFAGREP